MIFIYTIGEVSKLKGVTIRALRFYEKIGLLNPHYINPSNNYRYYSKEQFALIDIIKVSRANEISPADLIPIFNSRDSDKLIDSAITHKHNIKHKIAQLNRITSQIEEVEYFYNDSKKSLKNEEVYIKEIPDRVIIDTNILKPLTTEEISKKFSIIDSMIFEKALVNTYQTGILFKSIKGSFSPQKLFSVIKGNPSATKKLKSIKGGTYVCVNYMESNILAKQKILNEYLEKKTVSVDICVQVDLLVDIFKNSYSFFELQMKKEDNKK